MRSDILRKSLLLIHIPIGLFLSILGFMIRTPLFGVSPSTSEKVYAAYFIVLALILIAASTLAIFRKYTATISVVLTIIFGLSWSILISPTDMGIWLSIYFVLFVPLLLISTRSSN